MKSKSFSQVKYAEVTTVLWLCKGTGTSSHLFSNSYKNNKMHVKTEKAHMQAHVVSNRSSMSTLVTVQKCFVLVFFKFFFFLMLLPIDYKQCHALTLKCPLRAHIWNTVPSWWNYAGGL